MEEKQKSIKCPFCLNETFSSEKDNQINLCIHCQKEFTLIKCFHCTNKIFFKQKLNLDGINLKCPYKNCGKYFVKSSCGVCSNKLYFPGKFPEGSTVVCPVKTCNRKYAKIECPIENCCNVVLFHSGVEEKKVLYDEGNLLECKTHQMPVLFQKINCFHCLRRLVWISPNKAVEGQKILCPYDDCKKIFNRVVCPNPECKQSNIFTKGGLEFGSPIKCLYCHVYFHIIFCPFCVRNITFKKNSYVEGTKNLCPYQDCNKYFQMVNCCFCKRPNIWVNGQYLHGQKIKCAYTDCQRIFSKIPCPNCAKINLFAKGDFSYGNTYKCIYNQCQKPFTIFICPDCQTFQTITTPNVIGNAIRCTNQKCKNKYFNIRCPHCFNTIVGKDEPPFGQTVLCPYPNCSMLFNWLYCFKCRKEITSKSNSYHDGVPIQCKSENCGVSFANYKCPCCQKNNCYQLSHNQSILNENIKCNRTTCLKMFKPNLKQTIFSNCAMLIIVQSKSFFFVDPVKDAKEVSVFDSLIIKEDLYSLMESQMKDEENGIEAEQVQQNKKENEKNNIPQLECLLCMDNARESVFVPCGHRCVCYSCGESIMNKYKKCPICNNGCLYLLKKVFDS